MAQPTNAEAEIANRAAGGDPSHSVQDPSPPPIDPERTRMEQAIQQQGRELQAIRTALSARVPQGQAPPPNPAAHPDKKSLEAEFWKNPLDHSSAIAQAQAIQVGGAIMQQLSPTLEANITSQLRNTDPEIWDKFHEEVEQLIQQAAPASRLDLNTWRYAFDVIKGRHIKEISDMLAKRGTPPPEADRGPRAPSVRVAPSARKSELSDDEKAVAAAFHLTEDEYRHGKEMHNKDNDFRYSTVRNAFDGVVTFDSIEDERRKRAHAIASK